MRCGVSDREEDMRASIIFAVGMILGAVSWFICPLLGGKFEPFDSGLALSVGQVIMSVFGGYIGFSYDLGKMFLAVFGLYIGQVGYWYIFGSGEARAWILLGAFATLFLCVVPILTGVSGAVIRRILRSWIADAQRSE